MTIMYLLNIVQTGWAQLGSLSLLHGIPAGQTHVLAGSWWCDWLQSIRNGLTSKYGALSTMAEANGCWLALSFFSSGLLSSRLSLLPWLVFQEEAGSGFLA